MKAGQRVHVSGKLRSVPIELENEKRRTQTSVVANRIFVLENPNESENSSTEDTNQIDIVANVATNVIKNNDGPHIFKLATHFQRRFVLMHISVAIFNYSMQNGVFDSYVFVLSTAPMMVWLVELTSILFIFLMNILRRVAKI